MIHHISIYQIKNVEDVEYSFRNFDKTKFNIKDYQKVYELDIDDTPMLLYTDILEEVFCIFNMNSPKDFTGHSLSVSDVVFIDDKGYYCDSFGWSTIVL